MLNLHNFYQKMHKLCDFFLILSLVFTIVLLPGCSRKDSTENAVRTTFQMSTAITYQVVGTNPEQVIDELVAALEAFEQVASMHIATSDVARINDNAGIAPVEVNWRVYHVIERAIADAEQTGGLFDITVGALTDLWAITSDQPRVPAEAEIEQAKNLVDYHDIELSAQDNVYSVMLRRSGQKLDLGGIAKGYALDICREILEHRDVQYALISIGGNVMTYRDKSGNPFTVGVRYPEPGSTQAFCVLKMQDKIISTTGGYERFFEENGKTYHHVLDPRTGYPANSDLISVSIVLNDGMAADFLSTALFIGGLDYALEQMRGGLEAIVVDTNNAVYVTASLRDALVPDLCDTARYTFAYI